MKHYIFVLSFLLCSTAVVSTGEAKNIVVSDADKYLNGKAASVSATMAGDASHVGIHTDWQVNQVMASVDFITFSINNNDPNNIIATPGWSMTNSFDIPWRNIRLLWDGMYFYIGSGNSCYIKNPRDGSKHSLQNCTSTEKWNSHVEISTKFENLRIEPIDIHKRIIPANKITIAPVQLSIYYKPDINMPTVVSNYYPAIAPLNQQGGDITWSASTGGVLDVADTVEVAAGSQNVADIGTLKCTSASSIAVTTTMSPERLLIDGQPWQSGDRISCSGEETKTLTVKGPSLPLTPGRHTWTINFDYYVL
ncbi:hypothetical protein ID360_004150 [Salmonella enterica]|nr:hypothetical protein [Salmonella enterica]EGB2280613.1 hypothetical protein [Salmonella enterica]EGH0940764.1 hypothetical protein [Salmonella enterica]EGR7877082.1 hypothetical protein [Salmonella enterica]EGS9619921.1 hypothetical protein [Salmonella enterica]